jgi:hypothetical protein
LFDDFTPFAKMVSPNPNQKMVIFSHMLTDILPEIDDDLLNRAVDMPK